MQKIDPEQPLLSVVVIGRNEGPRLRRCLDSVRDMDFPGRVEVIYVDSASIDGSAEAAAADGAIVIVLDPAGSCAARARNAGWRVASAPFILFLDGDTILHPRFVERSMGSFAHPDVAVVWGHRREIRPEQSIYTAVLDIDWIVPAGDTAYCGGDALMRRSALAAVDGYNDTLIAGEEPELCHRLRARGLRIVHLDIPMTRHDLAITRFRQYWNRSVRTGHAYAEIARRFDRSPDRLWRTESQRNLVQGTLYLALLIAGIAGGICLFSPYPVLGAGLVLLAFALRTAFRNRAKSASARFLFAYGLHSHVQQIPIFVGQAGYRLSLLTGRRRELIEYHQGGL